MSDNVSITQGSGTTIAADDVGGALFQRVKLGLGADGSAADAVGGAGANSSAVQRVTLATDDQASAALARIADGDYETVAASATAQVLGGSGAAGDYLLGLLIVPATTSPGAVSIKDGSGSDITVFTGGANSVSSLVPFLVPLAIRSGSGAWKVTTGSGVSVVAMGSFS